ncbi:MAG: hypothetical protein JWQ87_5259 [Candidatus Sulfotelmatobacter sp.]|nr:hypothetical protein [Candidatus Sulfotelmatobacter sp.]
MQKISIAQLTDGLVQAEITRYWSAFCERSVEQLQSFFAPDAITLGTESVKPEPARLTIVRRSREYFGNGTRLKYSLGPIEVMILPGGNAIAAYTFQFSASPVTGGKAAVEEITNGRATQIFSVSADGTLQIVNEHFSLPMRK